jgi:hypothetical protein
MRLPSPQLGRRISMTLLVIVILFGHARIAFTDDPLPSLDNLVAARSVEGASQVYAARSSGELVEFSLARSAQPARWTARGLGVRAIGRFAVAATPTGRELVFAGDGGRVSRLELAGTNPAAPVIVERGPRVVDVLGAARAGDTLYVLAVDSAGQLQLITVAAESVAGSSARVQPLPDIEAASAVLVASRSATPGVVARNRAGIVSELAPQANGELRRIALNVSAVGSPVLLSGDEAGIVVPAPGSRLVVVRRKTSGWERLQYRGLPEGAELLGGGLAQNGELSVVARSQGRLLAAILRPGGTGTDWTVASDGAPEAGAVLELNPGAFYYVSRSYLAGALTDVVGPTITIDKIAPRILWTGESLTVTYTLRNGPATTLSGTVTASIDGVASAARKVAVSGLAPGAQTSDSFTLDSGASPRSVELAITFQETGRLTCLLALNVLVGGPAAPQNPRSAVPGIVPCNQFSWAQGLSGVNIHAVSEALSTDDPEPSPPFPGGSLACTSLTHCGNGRLDPPDPETSASCPVDASGSRVRAYNSQIVCSTAIDLFVPATEADVVSQVQFVTRSAVPDKRRLRVGGFYHTANPQLCTSGFTLRTSGLRAPNARDAVPGERAAILRQAGGDSDEVRQERLARWLQVGFPVVEQFEGNSVVRVAPGASLFDLADWLWQRPDQSDRPLEARDQLALGFALPGFRSPSVAGAIATGTHGSSTTWPDVISQKVASLRVVLASGAVVTFSEQTTGAQEPDTWRALKASLGYLGIVTEVRLKVEPAFKLSVRVTTVDGSVLYGPGGPQSLVSGCDFGQIMWFPEGSSSTAGHARVICGRKTAASTPGDADSRLFDPLNGPLVDSWRSALASGGGILGDCFGISDITNLLTDPELFKGRVAALMIGRMQRDACDGKSLCGSECLRRQAQELFLPFIGMSKLTDEVVGPAHRIMTSPLPAGTDAPLQRDWEIFVPRANSAAVIKEAHDAYAARETCLPLVGVFIRFARVNKDTLMAHTTAIAPFEEDDAGMFFEAPVFLPQGVRCSFLKQYESQHFDLAARIVSQFSGRPHWAKNRRALFQLQRRADPYGANQRRFQHVMESLDPDGLFANQFGRDIGLRWPDDVLVDESDSIDACVPDAAPVP